MKIIKNKARYSIHMKKVVIIGGGFAGSKAAKKLQKHFDVTLIDGKNFFEFTPGILRTIVKPEHIKKLQIPHRNYLKKTKVVFGTATEVTRNTVKAGKESYPYDYLLVCAGSDYSTPIKEHNIVSATRGFHLVSFHKKLKDSRDVLIIGGGLVGVELAAEICTHFKDKKITIVHSNDSLIERNSKRAQAYAQEFLRKNGVRIVFGERVMENKGSEFVTDRKTRIKCDIAFLCTGIKPNCPFMKNHFPNSINEKGQIRINKYLQIVGNENIFAPGDVNDFAIEKTAQNANYQAAKAARNILRIEKKKPLVEYKGWHGPMVISLGKWNGIFEWGNFAVTGFFPGILKILIEIKAMVLLKYF